MVSAVNAIRHHVLVEGDNALAALRARDVLSLNIPLLERPTTLALYLPGNTAHHPGPLYLYLLAIPVRLLPIDTGMVVGPALVNIAAVVGIALVARRRGHDVLMFLAMATVAMLGWSLGQQALRDAWQPYACVFPLLLLCLLLWSVLRGEARMLPVAVGVASLAGQEELSCLLPAALLGAAAVAGFAGRAVWERRTGRTPTSSSRQIRNCSLVAGLVLVLCWLPPLIQQITGHPGNITELYRALTSPGLSSRPPLDGLHDLVHATGIPPMWARALQATWPLTRTPSGAQMAAALAGLALTAGLLVRASRRGNHAAGPLVLAWGTASVAVVVTGMRAPKDAPLNGYALIWIWPLGAFLTLTLVWALFLSVDTRLRVRHRRDLTAVAAVAAVAAVVVACLAGHRFWEHGQESQAAIAALRATAIPATPAGPVLVTAAGSAYLSVLGGLQTGYEAHGHRVLVDEHLGLSYGERRVAGEAPHHDVSVVCGTGANAKLAVAERGDVIASWRAGESPADRQQRLALQQRVASALLVPSLPTGRLLELATQAMTFADPTGTVTVQQLLGNHQALAQNPVVAIWSRLGILAVPGVSQADIDALARLETPVEAARCDVYLLD